jgi:electron transport complex protein RnfD
MISRLKLNANPHTGAESAVSDIMRQVLLALLPATLFGIYSYGWPALFLLIITLAAAVAFEAGCLYLAGKAVKATLRDLSALLTGLLIAMTLPPWAPWWIGVVGAGLAIVVGKHVYGGLGQNLFNPAMLARVGLLIAFPVEMTTWVETQSWFSADLPNFSDSLAITFVGIDNIDAVSGASLLGHVKTELSQNHLLPNSLDDHFTISEAWLGLMRGSLAEGSLPLLILGGFWLLYKEVIRWHIPVALLGTVFVLASGFYVYDSSHYLGPFFHLCSGALILTAFFIATDYVTSPNTPLGQIIFGIGCGGLIFVIRTWGAYPEGAGFAVLLMNSVTPLIDHYIRPRIYGRDLKGKPLEVEE